MKSSLLFRQRRRLVGCSALTDRRALQLADRGRRSDTLQQSTRSVTSQREQVETTRWVAESAGERPPKSPGTMMEGHPVPFVRPPWKNVQANKRWENMILLARSKAEQVRDWICLHGRQQSRPRLHVVWFGAWSP